MSIYVGDENTPLEARRIDSYRALYERFKKLFLKLDELKIETLGDIARVVKVENSSPEQVMKTVEGLLLGNYQAIMTYDNGEPNYNRFFLALCGQVGIAPSEAYDPRPSIDESQRSLAVMGRVAEKPRGNTL